MAPKYVSRDRGALLYPESRRTASAKSGATDEEVAAWADIVITILVAKPIGQLCF